MLEIHFVSLKLYSFESFFKGLIPIIYLSLSYNTLKTEKNHLQYLYQNISQSKHS